jgi:hypothetical protein
MRQNHYTLTARDVTSLTRQTLLETLAWSTTRVEVSVLIQLLLRAAAQMRSLSAIVALATLTTCLETIRRTIHELLPDEPEQFLPTATRILHYRLPASLRKLSHTMAVDIHQRPYYGCKTTRGITQGQRKAGTRKFFAYATIMIIASGSSYTVGITPVAKDSDLTTILERLLSQVQTAGLSVKCLLLDREFYAAKIFHWLKEQSIAFIVPVIRRGRKGRRVDDCTGTQGFFVEGRRGWETYTWTAQSRRNGGRGAVTVTVEICMTAIETRKGSKQVAYACHGVEGPAATIVERYRRRFGIETSYRQLGEGLALTCSRHGTYRLLLVVIALLLRNVWLWLHAEKLSQTQPSGEPTRCLSQLRLRTMMGWLVVQLDVDLAIEAKVASGG